MNLNLLHTLALKKRINEWGEFSRMVHMPVYIIHECATGLYGLPEVLESWYKESEAFVLAPLRPQNTRCSLRPQKDLIANKTLAQGLPDKNPRCFLEQAVQNRIENILVVGPDTFAGGDARWLSEMAAGLKEFPIGCVMISEKAPSHVFKGYHAWVRNNELVVDVPRALTTPEAIEFITSARPKNNAQDPKGFLSEDLLDEAYIDTKSPYDKELETNLYSPMKLLKVMYAKQKEKAAQAVA